MWQETALGSCVKQAPTSTFVAGHNPGCLHETDIYEVERSRSTVVRWVQNGIPYVRDGQALLVSEDNDCAEHFR